MRALRTTCLCLFVSCLVAVAGCAGGTDQQPEYPDPAVVDRSADDLGLPSEEAEESSGGEEEASDEEPEPPAQVIEGEDTPLESTAPTLRIQAPRNGATIRSGAVSLRVALTNWPLAPEPGQHVHVIVDDEPYIAVRDISSPIDLNALVSQHLGHELAEGSHVVRVFPSRGHHESVKTAGAFAAVTFHYRRATEGFSFDAAAPLLTYSRPKGCNTVGSRVLLDFYVSNAQLAADGHRVRYTLDGQITGEIARWVPHWIEGLREGEHTVALQLIDASGAPVPGPFNAPTRTFQVSSSCA